VRDQRCTNSGSESIKKHLAVGNSRRIDTRLAVRDSGRTEKQLAVRGSDIIKTHLAVGDSGCMEKNLRDGWLRVCKEPSALQIGSHRK
jgi:hypothetical protein